MFYVDPYFSRKDSGARFFSALRTSLKLYPNYSEKDYSSVLLNVSSPISRFLIYKMRKKRIFIRLDGKYNYPITKNSLKSLYPIISKIFLLIYYFGFSKTFFHNLAKANRLIFLFNLKKKFSIYLKTLISSQIIYQSSFAENIYKEIFPNKKSTIINNFTVWKKNELPFRRFTCKDVGKKNIYLCTDFHKNRPLKGFGDLLIQLKNINKNHPENKIKLLIFGYESDSIIKTFSKKLINLDAFIFKNRDWISTYPKFKAFTKDLSKKIICCDAFITFSQYDVCPNIIIEALCHGLPIIATKSGGIPEIVKNCGILLPVNDQLDISSFNLNLENGVEPPNEDKVYNSILQIKKYSKEYKSKVKKHIFEETTYKIGCDLYANYLKT